jgi:AcrR family transcriptional regulator
MSPAQSRPLRADARRNREAIVAAARRVFEVEGIGAPLDGIACAAGVGNATLYRNFPTRDDLLAAVITDSVASLLAESADLDDTPSADAALREWLYRLAWQLRMWHDLPTCIADALGSTDSPVHTVCTRLSARTGDLLERARRDGSADPAVPAATVVELVTAASWGVDRFGDDADEARDRVALATAGVFTCQR